MGSVTSTGAYFRNTFLLNTLSKNKIGDGRLRNRIPLAFLAARSAPAAFLFTVGGGNE